MDVRSGRWSSGTKYTWTFVAVVDQVGQCIYGRSQR